MNNNYQKAVNLLTSIEKFRISLGLDRIQKILALLDNPQDKLKCIHVAGTNGKGSVCAIAASILASAGKKIGLYTSPHIYKYTERIKINVNKNTNFKDIPDETFYKYIFEINKLALQNNIDLTEFEILTAVMFKYFENEKVDVAIIETGMGGRFDATNVIKKNICSIITHIDYDHTEKLGNTLDKIAFEKAGIIKKNCPCIVCEGREVFYDVAMEVGAELEIITPFVNTENLALKGIHQQENLALSLEAVKKVLPNISQEVIDEGLKKVKHPCRFEYIKKYNLIIDASHNPNGIDALVKNLNLYYPNIPKQIIFGCLNNKNYPKMLDILLNSEIKSDVKEIYFYHFNYPNSCTFEELKTVCPIKCIELTNKNQINFNNEKLTIICGSFYMISQLKQFLE